MLINIFLYQIKSFHVLGEAAVVNYLKTQNRPYSASKIKTKKRTFLLILSVDIFNNLHGAVGKTALTKVLTSLVERGEIAGKAYGKQFVYGLPELNKAAIKSANYIANPGCFATAIQLGLLPLASKGLLNDVYTTGITGSTGAGQSLSATSHFSWRANNIQAYKTLQHQHLHEIGQSLAQLQGNQNAEVHFVPWRGDFTRGIFVSSVISIDLSIKA